MPAHRDAPLVACERREDLLEGRTVWVLRLANEFSGQSTLLLSKVSEAVKPSTAGNHVGEGATMDEFLQAQPGVRFIINGGFNHYRKGFYAWPHQDFEVGDPVGLVKIRHHIFEDLLEPSHYGFFVQPDKGQPWAVVPPEKLDRTAKYILGCTPLLVLDGQPREVPAELMTPMPAGQVNPPSVLGHGEQRHPRTAVGVQGEDLVFLLVEGGDSGGCTLRELQRLGLSLGLDSLLNLDGGGSSQFRLRGEEHWVHNHVDAEDADRVLGHVIVLFDEALKPHPSRSGYAAEAGAAILAK